MASTRLLRKKGPLSFNHVQAKMRVGLTPILVEQSKFFHLIYVSHHFEEISSMISYLVQELLRTGYIYISSAYRYTQFGGSASIWAAKIDLRIMRREKKNYQEDRASSKSNSYMTRPS
jgi:hypothetical protein